jgi:hypothetical protein
MTPTRQVRLPTVTMSEVPGDMADALLERWDHPLGECDRPYGRQDFVLEVDGEAIALTTSASTVSTTAAGLPRRQLVELARIARAPDHPHVLRVALRLWRAYLAQRWPYWPVTAAVSYAMPGTSGDLYRFDGWERVGKCRVSSGGGTYTSRDPKVSQIADGVKTLWIWRYEAAQAVAS